MKILTPFFALVLSLLVLLAIAFSSSSFFALAQASRGDEHGNVGSARGKQSEVDSLQHELVRAIQNLEHQYALKKVPMLKERNKFLNTVPGFWKRALTNHPNFGHVAHGDDAKILETVTSIDIDEVNPDYNRLPDGSEVDFKSAASDSPQQDHTSTKYLVRLSFDANAYFTDRVLWRLVDSYSIDVKAAKTSGVNWMPGQRVHLPIF